MSTYAKRLVVIFYGLIYLIAAGFIGKVEYEPFNGLSLVTLLIHLSGSVALTYVFIGLAKDMFIFKKRLFKDGAR